MSFATAAPTHAAHGSKPPSPTTTQAVDDLDALLARFAAPNPPHRKAILFVDNAGADVVLGMLPLARELIKRGTEVRAPCGDRGARAARRLPLPLAARGRPPCHALSPSAPGRHSHTSTTLLSPPPKVVIAANERPSINDITAPELRPLLASAGAADPLLGRALAERVLRVVSSGNDLGVIDLSEVSAEVAAEADGCDLVVLEGMGRGIETNLFAKFTVDAAKLAMIKVGWFFREGSGFPGVQSRPPAAAQGA
jgi:hypothetical protein